ncbi:MAG: DUF3047 domain-containing protein [Pseudomonadales bacterium]|nr:DUF3047 domain-containing protein [Pseudomonadales bacterium]
MTDSGRRRPREHTTLRRRCGGLLLVLALGATSAGFCAPGVREVSRFPEQGLEGWEHRRFVEETRYRIADVDGTRVLEADACGAASGLFRETEVELGETPVLTWRWWVDAPVAGPDPRTKAGDDFAARVYVVFSGGLAFWRTTALVYVWGTAEAPAMPWRNPFTDRAAMVVAERGAPQGDRLRPVRRDVLADYRERFGTEPPAVRAVAVMTDTDQTGACAKARYAELRFLPREDLRSP